MKTAKLFITSACISAYRPIDENGNPIGERSVNVAFNFETDIPFSNRYSGTLMLSEDFTRKLTDVQSLPLAICQRIGKMTYQLQKTIERKCGVCMDEEDDELDEQIESLLIEGLKAYFANYPEPWMKQFCKTADIRKGETVTLADGTKITAKENARIIIEYSNDRCRKEGLPDWMYEDNDEPDKLTKAKNEEKERITMEIMECNGDKLRAAKHLGYDLNTFLQKIVEYNIH